MKKKTIIILSIVALVVIIGGWFVSTRNNFVKAEEGVNGAWSQVETVYQRRADLVPMLVNTVKGASKYEQETFLAVTQARSNAMNLQLTGDDLTEENVANFQKMQDNLKSEFDKALNVTLEAYPELKATDAYRDLMTQIEGTENRISVERKNYNDAVQDYNKSIRLFPGSIVAGMCG
ncbi:MAG: LemA family protein, partial [Bacteroidales bacterium]|nr:LemA family protein [Bacteroidales bacterium]